MKKILTIFICMIPTLAFAQVDQGVEVPNEVKPFLETGMMANALESGDLNADGRKDYVLVMSKPAKNDGTFDDGEDDKRSTLVLIRDGSGKLSLAARNDHAAFCRTCGGVMGDPFQSVEIKGTSFTVNNYGGSSERWTSEYTFGYSRRDRTWQLTRAAEGSFSAFAPTKGKTRVYAPRNFGLINFADFNSDNYLKKGKK